MLSKRIFLEFIDQKKKKKLKFIKRSRPKKSIYESFYKEHVGDTLSL